MSIAKNALLSAPQVLGGARRDVIRELSRSHSSRTVAVTLPDDERFAAAETVFRRVAEFLPHLIEQRETESLERLVGVLLPDVIPSEAALSQARLMVDARAQILKSGDFIPPLNVAKLAGFSLTNPSVQPNKWKRTGAIFAIEHKGSDYFPLYALNPKDGYRPYAAVADVLKLFGNTKDGWDTAFWFAAINSFLDDERPQDVLATDPGQVIAAAEDEVEGVRHG